MLYDTRPVFYADNRQQIRELINETTRFYGAAAFSPLFRKSRRADPRSIENGTRARTRSPNARAPSLWRHVADEASVKVSSLILFPLDLAREIFAKKMRTRWGTKRKHTRPGHGVFRLVNRLRESKSRNGHPSTIYKEFRDSRLEEMPLQPMNHSGFVVRDSWYSKEALSD